MSYKKGCKKHKGKQVSVNRLKMQRNLVDGLAAIVFGSTGDDGDVVEEIATATEGMTQTERRVKRVEIMKAHSARKMAEARANRVYANYLVERKKLLGMQVEEQKRREYLKSRTKDRRNLTKRLKRAAETGLLVKQGRCIYCGDTFGYVAERKVKDGVVPIPQRNIPMFCSKACATRHGWETKRKKLYKEWKARRQKQSASPRESQCSGLKTTWRGYGNFYTNQARCTAQYNYNPFDKIDRVVG